MNKVSMITERKIDGFDASGNRAEWELDALKKNGFDDVELIDEFNQQKVSDLSNNLIHAQQLSGRLLENYRYIADAHGLESPAVDGSKTIGYGGCHDGELGCRVSTHVC